MSPKRADADPAAGRVPGAIWLRPRPPARAGGLERDRIASAAVGLLDRAGEAGLTLRVLAAELGVHATTLYWHVAVRDELLDLALDAVFAELDPPARPAPGWADEVAAYMHGLRAVLLRHPWSGPLASSRLLLGPAALAQAESVTAALRRGGLDGVELGAAAAAVSNLVLGTVAAESAWRSGGAAVEAAARAGMARHLAAQAERYPTLAALTAGSSVADRDAHFARAVDILIAGLRTSGTLRDEDR